MSQHGEAAPFSDHQSPLKQSAFDGYSPSNQYTKNKSHKEQHHWMDLQPIADNSQGIVQHVLFSTGAPRFARNLIVLAPFPASRDRRQILEIFDPHCV
jgi:hypothetical protein